MTVAECIHGLDLEECEVCSPRTPPEPSRTSHAAAARAPRAAKAPSKPAAGVAARSVDARQYLVVPLEELPAVLDPAALAADGGWRLAFDVATARTQAVIVSRLDDPAAVLLIGVANVPARELAAAASQAAGRRDRIVVNPIWFA